MKSSSRKGSAAAAVLVLALLAQAATAVGRAPCAMGESDPASTRHTAHMDLAGHAQAQSHHGNHHQTAATGTDISDDNGDRSCCDGMTPMDCAMGGCTLGGVQILVSPVTGPVAATMTVRIQREPDWLPPYLTLTASIFRPPIA